MASSCSSNIETDPSPLDIETDPSPLEIEIEDIKAHIESDHASPTSKYVKAIVYGGVDGVINTASVMASAVGASLGLRVIVLVGVATVLADSVSMGFSDWLSSNSKRGFYVSQMERAKHRVENNSKEASEQLIDKYCQDGMSPEDAKRFVEILSQDGYQDFLLRHTLLQNLGLHEPDSVQDIHSSASYTAGSVITFGSLPVLNYLFFLIAGSDDSFLVHASAVTICGVALCLCGVLGAIVTRSSKLKSAILNLIDGFGAIALGYLCGWGLSLLLG